MAFNFFKKNKISEGPKMDDTSSDFTEEDLDKVDAGYQKTQDDINKILAESTYINESKKDELGEMLNEGKQDTDLKSYQKK